MWIYDALGLAVSIAAVPLLPLLALTSVGRGLSERLGTIPASARALASRRPLWIHAASVGEVLAAAPLVAALDARGDGPVVMSTTSLTGRETARSLPGVAAAMLLPADIRWIVRRTIRQLSPRALVLVETELWPALISAAAEHGLPVVLVSGCISGRTASWYGRMRPLLRTVLGHMAGFAMQTQADADRVMTLGAPGARVEVIGSLKYARLLPAASGPTLQLRGTSGRAVLIAASTQPGEEQFVLDACRDLWSDHPDCLLLLAPRRPERFDEAERLLRAAGVRVLRRSQLAGAVSADTHVVLLDSVGELPGLLAGARAVFVGGTVAPLGGHNVLEPAASGVPVCFGPHTENVAEAAHALSEGGGAVRVHTAAELALLWRRLLADPGAARAMGARAQAVVQARAHVIDDTVALIERVLG
jgi:3-deoxy-D-manno-octulosonic-acid transferase